MNDPKIDPERLKQWKENTIPVPSAELLKGKIQRMEHPQKSDSNNTAGAVAPAAACSARVGDCPLEQMTAKALDAAGIRYLTDYEGAVTANLDFYLPHYDIYIEIKGGHSDRIANQMSRAPNVIAVQGEKSVQFLVQLLRQNS